MATVHVIGAGISGLSAATQLASEHVPVKLYEATASAGGRCRSIKSSELGDIDSGLHLISGADAEALRYLDRIKASDQLLPVRAPAWPFAPLADYVSLAYGMVFPGGKPLTHFLSEENRLYDEWARVISRAQLHTPLDRLSARAMRETLLKRGGGLYMAAQSLSDTFLAPALHFLDYCGGSVYFNHALTGVTRAAANITTLNFVRKKVALASDDLIILATPARFTQSLFPEVSIPESNHSAITLHFAVEHREALGTLRFLNDAPYDMLRYDDKVMRVAMRVATDSWEADQTLLAERCWKKLQALHPYLREQALGHWTMHREKRAGHLMDLETLAMPKAPLQPHAQCLLAGDWVDPSRPASIEAAVASGHRAADAAKALLGTMPMRRQ